jgi:GAF domain-containing protein
MQLAADLIESLAGRALRERRVLISDDCAADLRVVQPPRSEIGIGSMICVPLSHRGATIGVLSVSHDEPTTSTPATPRPWSWSAT